MKATKGIAIFAKTWFRLVQDIDGMVTLKNGKLEMQDGYYVEERVAGKWEDAELDSHGWVMRYTNQEDASRAFARLCSAQHKIQEKDRACVR